MIDLICDDIESIRESGFGRTILKLLILEFFGEEVGQMVLSSKRWELENTGLGEVILRTKPIRENAKAVEAIAFLFPKTGDQEIVGFIAVATHDGF